MMRSSYAASAVCFSLLAGALGAMDLCDSYAGIDSPACKVKNEKRAEASALAYNYDTTMTAAEDAFIQASFQNHDSQKERPPMRLPFGQSLVNMVVTAWRLFGAELAVFAVTICFAMVSRGPKLKLKGASTSPQAFSYQPQQQASPKPPAREVRAASPPAFPWRDDRQRLEKMRRRLEVPSGQQEAARILDEIVESMRNNASVRSASSALELYQQMRELLKNGALGLAEVTWHSKHSSFDLYTTLVQSAVRSSQCHLVVRLLDDMVLQGVCRPLSFYESTMKQLAGQKHYQLALNVYDRLAADGLTASAVTCSCLVNFATEVGEYERAIQFFQQLSQQSTPSIRAYMTILRVYNKRQDWESSFSTFKQMQAKNAAIDSLVLNVVLSTGVAADKVEEVDALIAEGSRTTPKMVDVVSYNTLIKGFIQRSELQSAVGLLERMKADNVKPNCITFNTMMDRAMRSLQEDTAFIVYEKMCEHGVRPDKVTCSILIKGLGKRPTNQHIKVCVGLLEHAAGCCDPSLFNSLQNIIVEAATRSGEVQLAAAAQEVHTRSRY
eukprot:TRINITY_DN10072_c0_g1_i4.p1 TRINITY_DN10072_c0_g1~~TRINITY_DN10072_c0_g1_i4.p1  ORF type:complete len:554 (+),score=165.30 TRINITY_DN10072_c0_g1_i4:219-1880(+)